MVVLEVKVVDRDEEAGRGNRGFRCQHTRAFIMRDEQSTCCNRAGEGQAQVPADTRIE
jgi:hypothetical protein